MLISNSAGFAGVSFGLFFFQWKQHDISVERLYALDTLNPKYPSLFEGLQMSVLT